jgi:hypothetical protein
MWASDTAVRDHDFRQTTLKEASVCPRSFATRRTSGFPSERSTMSNRRRPADDVSEVCAVGVPLTEHDLDFIFVPIVVGAEEGEVTCLGLRAK